VDLPYAEYAYLLDIRGIFCDACDQLGIEWRVMNATDVSIARHESVAMMDEFIGPKE
jgi:hypothetical protein